MSQRLRLNYVDWGNEDAPLLLLIHGSRDHCRSWDWTAQALAADWHVIAVDLRGHGDSAWSPEGRYDIAGHVYDVAQLLFQIGQPATIIGHSLGAHVAFRYAALFPDMVRALAAIEAVGAPPEVEAGRGSLPVDERLRRWIVEKRAAAGRSPRRYAGVDQALERMRAENRNLSDGQLRHLTFHGIARNEDGSWSWKFDPYLRLWPFIDLSHGEILQLWRMIRCPTLLIYGEEGWRSDLNDDIRRCLPHAAIIRVAHAGHWPHHDRFDQFIAAARGFLATLR
jgi:pimeloyl-ACP methyl ester carboxylesterase